MSIVCSVIDSREIVSALLFFIRIISLSVNRIRSQIYRDPIIRGGKCPVTITGYLALNLIILTPSNITSVIVCMQLSQARSPLRLL